MKKYAYINILIASLVLAVFVFTACEKDKPEPSEDILLEGWKIELVDSIAGEDVGIYNKLVYDVDSGIHIAYIVSKGGEFTLKYAYKHYNGSWVKTEVENALSDYQIDITADKQKNIFIAYRGYETGNEGNELMYIAEKNINGTFSKVPVRVLGDQSFQARYPALYADNNNTVHISFERANYGIRYTTYNFQGTFSPAEILDDNISPSSSDIVVDSEGNKHIAHFNNEKVYYSFKGYSDINWTVNHIATANEGIDSYSEINIGIDRFDNLHAAYRYGSYDNNIHYLYKAAGSDNWQEQSIGNAGGSNRLDRAMACDTLGNPHILYDANYGLKIASKKGGWSHEAIMGNSDYRCDENYDLEIMDNNQAHVSFYCRTTGVLRYATKVLE